MKKNFKKVLLASIASVAIIACSDDDDSGSNPSTTSATNATLTTIITGLEDLGTGFVYEGWIMVNGTPMSTGTFTINADGQASQTQFMVNATNLAAATKYILTIEPNPDPDPAPSDQKLIAGDFSGNIANANTATAPALGDFSNAGGTFFLRTPTDEVPGAGNNGNDEFGVWFGTPGMPPTEGLTLPTLPQGWAYEGWVLTPMGPITTGTFTAFDERDGSNIFSGTENNAGPPIPGEDFFNNPPMGWTFPLDIRGNSVIISVEPVPDNSPAPFLLKPLLSVVDSMAATAPASHNFGQNLGTLPIGVITR